MILLLLYLSTTLFLEKKWPGSMLVVVNNYLTQGTGSNIEQMNEYMPISSFDYVYMVDLTPSLCEIARKRFKRLGWSNVVVCCVDALEFKVPEKDGNVQVVLVTMSYSLTMMETSFFYPIVDFYASMLDQYGIFGVADFYVSSKRSLDEKRQNSWLTRWFWAMAFDAENLYLVPGRREYVEHRFKTIDSISGLNNLLPLIYIPYYVFVGHK